MRSNDTATTETPDLYGRNYFEKHFDPPYNRGEPRWLTFLNSVVEEVIRSLNPRSVLDAGCAIGFLVEAFWHRGVRTWGIDISEYAISQVPQDHKAFCRCIP